MKRVIRCPQLIFFFTLEQITKQTNQSHPNDLSKNYLTTIQHKAWYNSEALSHLVSQKKGGFCLIFVAGCSTCGGLSISRVLNYGSLKMHRSFIFVLGKRDQISYSVFICIDYYTVGRDYS